MKNVDNPDIQFKKFPVGTYKMHQTNPEFEQFKANKNLRHIKDNEIVFDVDNREIGFEAINFIGINLLKAGYNFEIWYAEGQKSPHLHIKNIYYLENLTKEQLRKYKEKLVLKFTPEDYKEFTDMSVCVVNHLIAEENKPHHKYKTIKKLCGVFNENNENFVDDELFDEVIGEYSREYKPNTTGSGITAKIIQNISIIEVAKQFGLSVDSRGFSLCPFHPDNKPSLKFYENQGRFCCFGCNEKGNIIYFYALLKELKPSFKYVKGK